MTRRRRRRGPRPHQLRFYWLQLLLTALAVIIVGFSAETIWIAPWLTHAISGR